MANAFSDYFGMHDERRVFPSLNDFRKTLDEYSLHVGCAYRIRSTEPPYAGDILPRRRLFMCTRGGAWASKSTGERTRASQTINCPSTIAAKRHGDGYIAINEKLEHNHPLDAVAAAYAPQHRRPTTEQMIQLEPMLRNNFSSASISQFVNSEMNKKVFTRDVKNWKHSLIKSTKRPNYLLQLSQEMNQNGRSRCIMNADNYVTHFIFMTANQLSMYRKYPELIGMDATYDVCREAYVLFQLVAVDANNKGFSICFGFLSQETTESIVQLLETFREMVDGRVPDTILMDDSAASQRAVSRVFPNTNIRLCRVHLLRNLRARVSVLFY